MSLTISSSIGDSNLDVPPNDVVETNRQLRKAYAEIAQLAGGLAHEIRNPLSTMRMNLDLLAEDFARPENSRDKRVLQKIDRVRKESHRLELILEDFLRFARAQELRTARADLNSVLEEVCDFCEGQGVSRGVISRMRLDHNLPKVELDSDLFNQALLNLILNAQNAMPDGGELILTTHREERWAVLDVTDTGTGIAPENLTHIFDAFFSTRSGGSGLGLPTARKIIEAHGGSISVESDLGKGSKFRIRIPLSPDLSRSL